MLATQEKREENKTHLKREEYKTKMCWLHRVKREDVEKEFKNREGLAFLLRGRDLSRKIDNVANVQSTLKRRGTQNQRTRGERGETGGPCLKDFHVQACPHPGKTRRDLDFKG